MVSEASLVVEESVSMPAEIWRVAGIAGAMQVLLQGGPVEVPVAWAAFERRRKAAARRR